MIQCFYYICQLICDLIQALVPRFKAEELEVVDTPFIIKRLETQCMIQDSKLLPPVLYFAQPHCCVK